MQKSKVECLIEVFYLKADGAYQYVCMSQDEGKIREKEGDIEIESCLFFFGRLDIHNHDTRGIENGKKHIYRLYVIGILQVGRELLCYLVPIDHKKLLAVIFSDDK